MLSNKQEEENNDQKQSTKRALLGSVISLLLCVAMLIGATFAWFTDSITSGKNQIIAGNLDLVLETTTDPADDKSWTEVASDTLLFKKDSLYEPGYTEIVYLRVRNAGTLAFKYQLAVNAKDLRQGINVAGNKFKLTDYLLSGTVENVTAAYENRADAIAAITEPVKLGSYTINNDIILNPGESTKAIALIVYMPATVGNEANYQTGKNKDPQIELGVTALATQATVERDSFNNQYDKDAEYYTAIGNDSGNNVTYRNAINAALKTGNVSLRDDLNATATGNTYGVINFFGNLATAKTVNPDLNGNSVTNTRNNGGFGIYVYKEGTLIINGNGTVNGGSGGNNQAVHAQDGANVIINGGTYTVGADATGNGNSCIEAGSGATVTIHGGIFESQAQYAGKHWVLNLIDNSDAQIIVKGGTFVNFNPSQTGTEPVGVSDNFVAAGYKVVSETQTNGDIWYTVVPK